MVHIVFWMFCISKTVWTGVLALNSIQAHHFSIDNSFGQGGILSS